MRSLFWVILILALSASRLWAGEYLVINSTNHSGECYYLELFYDGGTTEIKKDDQSLGTTIVGLDTAGIDVGDFRIDGLVAVDGVRIFPVNSLYYPHKYIHSFVASADFELNKEVLKNTKLKITRPTVVRVGDDNTQNRVVAPLLYDKGLFKGNSVQANYRTPPVFKVGRGQPVAVHATTAYRQNKPFTVYHWQLSDVLKWKKAFIDLTNLPSGEYGIYVAFSNGDILGRAIGTFDF